MSAPSSRRGLFRRPAKLSIDIPNVRLPTGLGRVPQNPPGWNTTEITIREAGLEGAESYRDREPAGEPPGWWNGTRPEWSIYWGLQRNGLEPAVDFTYKAMLPTVGSSYYSNVDFVIPKFFKAIEVQGIYWHYGQGTDKQIQDELRRALIENYGITVIFIDEPDALSNPEYYVREALAGRDHSLSRRR